jgi:hypothetical protein
VIFREIPKIQGIVEVLLETFKSVAELENV